MDDLPSNSLPCDPIPELKGPDLLTLCGGCQEKVKYFLSLRETLAHHRANGEQPRCDPRDHEMVKRLEAEDWRPQVTVKYFEDVNFSSKQTAVDADDAEAEEGDQTESAHDSDPKKSFLCGVNGCHQVFTTIASFDSHYQNSHAFVCDTCKKTFVSNFLLDIHLEESHDSYFQILSQKVDMYRCLVESCDQKFRTAELRNDHLVSDHKYPDNFTFHGLISPKTKVQSNETSNTSCGEMVTEGMEGQDVKSKGNKKSKGRGKRVPAVVNFGYHASHRSFQLSGGDSHWHQRGKTDSHWHQRGKTDSHWHQRGKTVDIKTDLDTAVDIETFAFSDLAEILDEGYLQL
ncbi:uncharacterized protein LOC131929615 [Physella acuta]|uniref:uncharacterized protein LOC131929615 n=1 Tax=Physella acuta TaxID=109671 RepID=UPI0027DB71C6|nr:uncharacterized protein LOC131929615 [Physella acuta]